MTLAGAQDSGGRNHRPLELLVPVSISAAAFSPLVIAAVVSGAWQLPQNDDWEYSRSALILHSSGHVVFGGWSRMTLIGQLILVQPLLLLHASVSSVHVFAVAAAVLFVVAVWGIAREVLASWPAACVAAVAACAPLVGILSTTFMTDVIAAALQAVCIYCGIRTLRPTSPGSYSQSWLVLALLAGLIACTVRESAVSAPLSVGIVVLLQSRRGVRPDVFIVSCGVVFAGALVALLEWRAHQPGFSLFGGAGATPAHLVDLAGDAAVVALSLGPLLLVLPWQRLFGRGTWAAIITAGLPIAIAVALWALLWRPASNGALFPGNLLAADGPLSSQVLNGPRPLIFTATHWADVQRLAVVLLGALLAALVGGLFRIAPSAVRRRTGWHSRDGLIAVSTLFAAVAVVVQVLATGGFDRYVVPILITLPALLFRLLGRPVDGRAAVTGASRRSLARAHQVATASAFVLGLAALGALTFALSANGDAYDVARWRAGLLLTTTGLPAQVVDAGYEWVGWHVPIPIQQSGTSSGTMPWYEGALGEGQVCELVSNVPSPPQDPNHIIGKATVVDIWTDVAGRAHALYSFSVRPC